jgi:hypothetical protein
MNSPGFSPLRADHGVLIEYTLADIPLVLPFVFNPTTVTRSRSVSASGGDSDETRGGYDFVSPAEAARASQGASPKPESLSLQVMFDATDRLNAGDPIAQQLGVQPELDTLWCMLQPRPRTPEGGRVLSAIIPESPMASCRSESIPVLLFKWGPQILPVFLTKARLEKQEYLPNLYPYHAEAALELQVIESRNPFFAVERLRQQAAAKSQMSLLGSGWNLTKPY